MTFSAKNLHKQFGGLIAVNAFSINLKKGRIHALIGPNGAGKSTAISLLTGETPCDSGEVEFNQQDITALAHWQRAQLGIGRTYQITSVVGELSVTENVLIALLANTCKSYIGLSDPFKNKLLIDQAHQILNQFDLTDSASKLAGELAHGQQARLEIAICVSTEPDVLLLDEPMSGMSLVDSQSMIKLLSDLKDSAAILLVEHDMDAVFKLADEISVMAEGKIIACDHPQAIKQNPAVINAYLGDEHA